MSKLTVFLVCCGSFLLPLTVNAYVGPGAGLSLLGALWALLLAILMALAFIFAWPIRRMLRRKREARELEAKEREESAGFAAPDTGEPSVVRQDD
jgi:membrane protein implicated in regulation of membrane protease activity